MRRLILMGLTFCLAVFVVIHHRTTLRDNLVTRETDRKLQQYLSMNIPEHLLQIEKNLETDLLNSQHIHKAVSVRRKQTDARFSTLLADYRKQIQALKDGGYWRESPQKHMCDEVLSPTAPCREKHCNATVTPYPLENLRSLLTSTKDLDIAKVKEITRLLRVKHNHKKVLFVTAASSNHFHESQALIHNLHDNVFPYMTNYSFVYYDLGLTQDQRKQLKKFCRCEVRTFPVSAMPLRLQDLKCYTWKPLIIHANLPTADMLVWTDASVRFRNRAVLELLADLDEKKININWGGYPIAHHTESTMFGYFAEKPCSFSHVPETAANFLTFTNERFVREVVIKPWVACALSQKCMCPDNYKSLFSCSKKIRKYHKCHRFDQSALGIILTKLFRGHEISVKVRPGMIRLRRGHTENYFDMLTKK